LARPHCLLRLSRVHRGNTGGGQLVYGQFLRMAEQEALRPGLDATDLQAAVRPAVNVHDPAAGGVVRQIFTADSGFSVIVRVVGAVQGEADTLGLHLQRMKLEKRFERGVVQWVGVWIDSVERVVRLGGLGCGNDRSFVLGVDTNHVLARVLGDQGAGHTAF